MNKDLNKLHELEIEQESIKVVVERIDERVGSIHKLMYGNGDTDKSVVVRLSQVTKDVARMTWAVGIVFVLAMGIILERLLF